MTEVKPWKCMIFLGGYCGTTFGVYFLGAIVTTGRFVAFAPHVTRGFCKGNAFGVFNTDYLNYLRGLYTYEYTSIHLI